MVGDKTYLCPVLIVDFLSPRIARIHVADDTISSFRIETRNEGEFFGKGSFAWFWQTFDADFIESRISLWPCERTSQFGTVRISDGTTRK
jgi:hypothetical protein